MKKYKWHKQTITDDCPIIRCPAYDPIADFQRDPSGYYVLIRLLAEEKLIEVAFCDKGHVIRRVLRGKKPQDIYYAVFQMEKKEKIEIFGNKQHTAYFGKELYRAYSALKNAEEYIQE